VREGRTVVANIFSVMGIIAAVITDAAGLARDTVPAPREASNGSRLWITPTLARDHQPAGLNLGGSF